jgi:hypothetical protein
MATITTNRSRSAHRAQIVAESVISAYIYEIARPAPRVQPAPTHDGRIQPLKAAVHPAARRRGEHRPFALPRHRDALRRSSDRLCAGSRYGAAVNSDPEARGSR